MNHTILTLRKREKITVAIQIRKSKRLLAQYWLSTDTRHVNVKIDPEECVRSLHGEDYMGKVNVTYSGRICQRWDTKTPHIHKYMNQQENYCRNPNISDLMPWCYTVDSNVRWEYCDIPYCDPDQECIRSTYGKDYMGKVNVTITGRTCQRWDTYEPHISHYTEQENYCRNPDRDRGSLILPWCYTIDPDVRWEFCDIGQLSCNPEECVRSLHGEDYLGKVNVTISGRTCQRWSTQNPHSHQHMNQEENYCRNPNFSELMPWCYTIDQDVKWEYCDIPYCDPGKECIRSTYGKDYMGKVNVTISGRTCQHWETDQPHSHNFMNSMQEQENYCRNPERDIGSLMPWCYTIDPDVRWEFCDIGILNCTNPEEKCIRSTYGEDYLGKVNVTFSGKTCQRWDTNTPHSHQYMNQEENYCRNLDISGLMPWCYTIDPDVKWEYCDIPYCDPVECIRTTYGVDYLGKVNVTFSGRTCQRWDTNTPYSHRYMNQQENYCRNLDRGDLMPWCYTIDPDVRYEFCDIPYCDPDLECIRSTYDEEYMGKVNVTISGRTCQRWDTNEPHYHSYMKSIPEQENYCRNPDRDIGSFIPWCFTIDPDVRWEFCDIGELNCSTQTTQKYQESEQTGITCTDEEKHVNLSGTLTEISGYNHNDILTYSCEPPYKKLIQGDLKRTCTESGNWSGIEPVCETCMCPCRKTKSTPILTPAEFEEMLNGMKVNSKKTSKAMRRKTCATDDRPSAKAAGFVGIVILVVAGLVIIVPDIPVLYRDMKRGLRKIKSS